VGEKLEEGDVRQGSPSNDAKVTDPWFEHRIPCAEKENEI